MTDAVQAAVQVMDGPGAGVAPVGGRGGEHRVAGAWVAVVPGLVAPALAERMRWVCHELFARPARWRAQWVGRDGYGLAPDDGSYTTDAAAVVWPEGIPEFRDTWLDWLAATSGFAGPDAVLRAICHRAEAGPTCLDLPAGSVLWHDGPAVHVAGERDGHDVANGSGAAVVALAPLQATWRGRLPTLSVVAMPRAEVCGAEADRDDRRAPAGRQLATA